MPVTESGLVPGHLQAPAPNELFSVLRRAGINPSRHKFGMVAVGVTGPCFGHR